MVSALLTSLAAIVALLSFVMTIAAAVWSLAYESVHRFGGNHRAHRISDGDAIWIIALVLFAWALWQAGLSNYRYADRSVTRVLGHAVLVGALLVISFAAAGAIMAHIMLPKHPMPTIPLTQSELADLAAYILSMRKSG